MNYITAAYWIEDYVIRLFTTKADDNLCYHNLSHTQKVVHHCEEIAAFYQLHEQDRFLLIAAAWFHDTGHLFTGYANHEKESVHVMQTYCNNEEIAPALTASIAQCIMATQLCYHPTNKLEEIICDADTYHFGTAEFLQTDPLVKKEVELRTGKHMQDWYTKTLHLLQNHTFYTDYCRSRLDAGKQANIHYLQSLVQSVA